MDPRPLLIGRPTTRFPPPASRRYDKEPEKWIKQYTGTHGITKKDFTIDVGYERFLGPEIFFHPEVLCSFPVLLGGLGWFPRPPLTPGGGVRCGTMQFVNPDFTTSISDLVDTVVQECPIDTRRGLYKNIVLSGGSTMFKDFGKRLQRDVKKAADNRLKISEKLSGGRIKVWPHRYRWIGHWRGRGGCPRCCRRVPTDPVVGVCAWACVCVCSRRRWRCRSCRTKCSASPSGSAARCSRRRCGRCFFAYSALRLFGSTPPVQPEFYKVCHTKKDYDEYGPSICRHNPVFGTMS